MRINLKYLSIAVFVFAATNTFAQIGIGTNTPAASAALEVSSISNNKGILIPRITATQKDAISNPVEGLMIYQTTAPVGFYFYTGNSWLLLVSQRDLDLKVVKVSGKDLSSNDYTIIEKTKLAAIIGSNTGDQDLSALATIASVALKADAADLTSGLANKVDNVTGKELSSNDYTSAEKTKLAAIIGNNTGDQDLSALATISATTTALNLKVDKIAGERLINLTESTTLSNQSGTNTGDQDLSVLASIASVALKAPIENPVFTGTPRLPSGTIAITQAPADNSTKLATTAYADAAAAAAGSFVDLSTNQIVGGLKTFNSIDGLLATGTYGSGTESSIGAGTRMMWYPKKSAFRAGTITGNKWDNAQIGNYSIAMGNNTTASGESSTAMGYTNVASGDKSTAMGSFNIANGNYSTAMGLGTTASGYSSIAMGDETTASGRNSTTMGKTTIASDYASLVIGQFNNRGSNATSATAFSTTAPAFVIGNGLNNTAKSDAFVVDFAGNVTANKFIGDGSQLTGISSVPKTGNTTGDMLYWNGTAWVKVAAGSNGQALIFSGGKPVWSSYTITGSLPSNTVLNTITNKIWMDRNLGAAQVATSSIDDSSYGNLYQWGRGADGHELRNSGNIPTRSSSDNPGNSSFIYYGTDFPSSWRTTPNDNLWQGVNGVNNPCPTGFRVPTMVEFDEERLSWNSSNAAGAFSSSLKLPKAGWRNFWNGGFSNLGTNGLYWSSTIDGGVPICLFINDSSSYISNNQRASGYSLRCIKD